VAWDLGVAAAGEGLSAQTRASYPAQLLPQAGDRTQRPLRRRTRSLTHSTPAIAAKPDAFVCRAGGKRIEELFEALPPPHRPLSSGISVSSRGKESVLVALHSFTPVYAGVGAAPAWWLLHGRDGRLGVGGLRPEAAREAGLLSGGEPALCA